MFIIFAVWGGVVSFFAVWADGVLFLFAVWAVDGSSLTYRSAWLGFKGPNNKKDQTAKTKHGFQQGMPARTVSEALSGVSGSEHEVCD